LFGVLKKDKPEDEEAYVEQKFAVQVPRGESDENISQFIWVTKFLPQMCLRAVGSAGEVNFYPLDRFSRFTIKVSSVVGVNLG